MTFEAYSTTGYASRPAELYEFRYGDNPADIFRFTSHDHDITVGADTYTSLPLKRDGFSDEGTPDDGNTLQIDMPRINDLGDLYRIQPPEKTVTVKIRALQLDDPDQQVITIWSGRIISVAWEHPQMFVNCERISTSLKRTGLRARYQKQCRHCHYDTGCGLDKANWLVTDTVTLLTSSTVFTLPAAAGFDDGYFSGGIVELDGTMRLIIGHVGDQITINRPLPGLAATVAVNAYPGCDRTAVSCADKYNNIENYGGFDFIPSKGPFEGSSLV